MDYSLGIHIGDFLLRLVYGLSKTHRIDYGLFFQIRLWTMDRWMHGWDGIFRWEGGREEGREGRKEGRKGRRKDSNKQGNTHN